MIYDNYLCYIVVSTYIRLAFSFSIRKGYLPHSLSSMSIAFLPINEKEGGGRIVGMMGCVSPSSGGPNSEGATGPTHLTPNKNSGGPHMIQHPVSDKVRYGRRGMFYYL